MKITRELYVKYLIKFYKARHWHKDYQDMHTEQLSVLNKTLDIENLIVLNYESKYFEFKNIGRINKKAIDKRFYENLINGSELDYVSIASYVSMYINSLLEKIILELVIFRGDMCTNNTNELVKSCIN